MNSVDSDIENVRQSLIKSFAAYRKSLVIALDSTRKQNSALNNQVKQVPQKERLFLDFTRQQNLKEQLYLFLLQKREETAITRTSTISTARIIATAKSDYDPYKPNKAVIYVLGLFAGLLLPVGYLYGKDILNIKVETKQDVENVTSIPIVGEIGSNKEINSVVVNNNSRSVLSEQFRSLRTNLQYLLHSQKSQVILLTSGMSGEGKSFITVNLGSTLAISGKKVVLLELDLRKPKISSSLDIDNTIGFPNYMVSENDYITKINKPSLFHKNCFIISSGPIPPNPSELLLSDKLECLITQLKNHFD